MVGPPGVRRIPGAVETLVAIGGEQDKGGADEDNNGAHGREDGVCEGETPASDHSLKTIDSYKKLCDKRIRRHRLGYPKFQNRCRGQKMTYLIILDLLLIA